MHVSFVTPLVDEALLTSGQRWPPLEYVASIGSTNDRARELATSGAPAWSVVVADEQTGGRGRLGRVWQQPFGSSLICSVTMPLGSPQRVGWVPLVAGLALAEALEQVCERAGQPSPQPRLKWPNDVLLGADGDRKVAGILCEAVAGRDAALRAVVVGTGVNVAQTRAELPVDTATSLGLAGVRLGHGHGLVSREALAATYLERLRGHLQELADERSWGTAASGYRARCATLGRQVAVHVGSDRIERGTAVRVDEDGRLVVRHADGERAWAAGDVTHLRAEDAPVGPWGR